MTAYRTALILAAASVVLAACDEDMGMASVESAPAASAAPTVGSPTDVSSFEGARAGQAEGGLRNLGYEPIRSEGLTTWWFNRASGACARIRTANGRYEEVTMLPAQDC